MKNGIKKILKKRTGYLITIIIASIWLVIAVIHFAFSLNSIQLKEFNQNLEGIAKSNAYEVDFVIKKYTSILSSAGEFVEAYDDITSSDISNRLNNIKNKNGFVELVIDFIDSGNVEKNIIDYNNKIKLGEPFVLDVEDTLSDEIPDIDIVVPIKNKEGLYRVAIRGSISTSNLSAMLNKTFSIVGGYFHVVDGNGRYVATGGTKDGLLLDENYFDAIKRFDYQKGFSYEKIINDFEKKQYGKTQYTFEGNSRHAFYYATDINDWVVLMVVPKEIMESGTKKHSVNVGLFIIQFIIIFLLFTYYIYTTKKKAVLNQKCFKELSEQTNKVIFEWDFETNRITSMSNFKVIFGREASTVNDAQDALSVKSVHEDDKEEFTKVFTSVLGGVSIKDARFRVRDIEGVYHWCSLSGIVIKDNKGRPFKAIGSLESIADQVNKEEALREKAEHDQLTGLFNKTTSENLIKETLKKSDENDKHALLIIDVDNYKNINDKLGHLYGDIVLAKLASSLKSIFRENDIVGRLGGDEFFVLIKNYANEDLLDKKAKDICRLFNKSYSDMDKHQSISASVGIAVYPTHGKEFEHLYKNADNALYNIKSSGKNNYKIYDSENSVNYISGRTDIDIFENKQKSFEENRVEYIFRLLYESDNIGGNIMTALQFIAENFGFSRGYIFETDSSGLYTNNTFEWCDDDVTSQIDGLQKLDIDVIKVANDSFIKKGYFILRNLLELPEEEREILDKQHIKSMLQFGIMKKGDPIGFIGFDNCQKENIPTTEEIEELKLICDVFATFLTKQRTTELAKSNYTALLTILNNFEGLTYVVSSEDYKVLFENDNIRDIVKNPSVGKYCYKEYMNRDTPCEKCPIPGVNTNSTRNTVEVDNKIFNVCSRVTASKIEWVNGKEEYLLSCIDITEYKNPKVNPN